MGLFNYCESFYKWLKNRIGCCDSENNRNRGSVSHLRVYSGSPEETVGLFPSQSVRGDWGCVLSSSTISYLRAIDWHKYTESLWWPDEYLIRHWIWGHSLSLEETRALTSHTFTHTHPAQSTGTLKMMQIESSLTALKRTGALATKLFLPVWVYVYVSTVSLPQPSCPFFIFTVNH